MAGDMFKPEHDQILARLEQTTARANASRDLAAELRAWAGFDGAGVEAMSSEQQASYLQWCGRRLEVAEGMLVTRMREAASRREHWEEAFLAEEADRDREERERRRRTRRLEDAARGDRSSRGDGAGPSHGEGEFIPPTRDSFGRGSRSSGGTRAPGSAPPADGDHDAEASGGPAPNVYVDISDDDEPPHD